MVGLDRPADAWVGRDGVRRNDRYLEQSQELDHDCHQSASEAAREDAGFQGRQPLDALGLARRAADAVVRVRHAADESVDPASAANRRELSEARAFARVARPAESQPELAQQVSEEPVAEPPREPEASPQQARVLALQPPVHSGAWPETQASEGLAPLQAEPARQLELRDAAEQELQADEQREALQPLELERAVREPEQAVSLLAVREAWELPLPVPVPECPATGGGPFPLRLRVSSWNASSFR